MWAVLETGCRIRFLLSFFPDTLFSMKKLSFPILFIFNTAARSALILIKPAASLAIAAGNACGYNEPNSDP